MNIDIRSYIKSNFKNTTKEDIKTSIEDSIKEGDDVTLPGLGVFFEIVWNNSSEDDKEKMLENLLSYLK